MAASDVPSTSTTAMPVRSLHARIRRSLPIPNWPLPARGSRSTPRSERELPPSRSAIECPTHRPTISCWSPSCPSCGSYPSVANQPAVRCALETSAQPWPTAPRRLLRRCQYPMFLSNFYWVKVNFPSFFFSSVSWMRHLVCQLV